MTAEEMLETYYSLKDNNDRLEAELEGRAVGMQSYDELYKREVFRRENIRLHGNDTGYARRLLEGELDRGNELSRRRNEHEQIAAAQRQRQYDEEAALDDLRRRHDRERREEERRQEEYDRLRYEEERRREEEDYRRRRQADEEYYAQLRDRNR